MQIGVGFVLRKLAGTLKPSLEVKNEGDYWTFTSVSTFKTHPVGQKVMNGFGLYDMSGNVREWCEDWKGEYAAGDQTDPEGPSGGQRRVLRGGSWYYSPEYCRSAYRGSAAPGNRNNGVGFRVVRTQK